MKDINRSTLMKQILTVIFLFLTIGSYAQLPMAPSQLEALGTRSWIRVDWDPAPNHEGGYKLYWSDTGKKPNEANAIVESPQNRYYITDVTADRKYKVWVEACNGSGTSTSVSVEVITEKSWRLSPKEIEELKNTPSSTAVPTGMELFWHDEFNDLLLNRNKWSTNYYSSIDQLRGDFEEDMRNDNLAQPAYILNGKTINLYTSDSLPVRVYDQKNNKKISSIQTYDWRTNECLLDNSRGGYFEVKVKRKNTGKPRGLNTAFWFDAPGPDLRNYFQEGTEVNGVKGVRPKGQVFEIDVFEYISAQFVLHGHVDQNGRFLRNLNTHIAEGYDHFDNWVIHGILWSPTTIKHYINGDLIKEYSDKENMHSPNHFMNVFLGSYGGGGTVNMEVDYIRMYQWPLKDGNELPNPGFDDGDALMPWEGTGHIVAEAGTKKTNAIVLEPGQYIEQYVYLDNDQDYRLTYESKGKTDIVGSVDNVTLVNGSLSSVVAIEGRGGNKFRRNRVDFRSGKEYDNYKKKMRVWFKNNGKTNVVLDDIQIVKR